MEGRMEIRLWCLLERREQGMSIDAFSSETEKDSEILLDTWFMGLSSLLLFNTPGR
jgi:hypothetical protein